MGLKPTGISPVEQLALYERMLLPRLIEEKSLVLLRQGKISKWFAGIGQEAVAVGLSHALELDDYILPLHRNLGVFTTREFPLERLFAQWQGKSSGYTNGRDRSFHFGAPEHRVIGMISHLGAMLGVADGLALAAKLDGRRSIAAVFSGDGGASEGDFHEAINVAAVWDLPVIFLVENNGYGLSTPSNEQYRCRQFVDKAVGYGIDGRRIEGNDVFEVYRTVREVAASLRERPRPFLLEAMTFRMRGHEEASGTKYVPNALMEVWQARDPVLNLERRLLNEGIINDDLVSKTRAAMKARIDEAWDRVLALPPVKSDPERELADVYAPRTTSSPPAVPSADRSLRLVDAVSEGLRVGMRSDPGLVLMGQDVAEYGGVFKVTEGFVEEFGRARVRNTPLCESAVLGCALGLATAGRSAVVEMQFADFVSCGFNQIVNNLAKTHYRWGQPVNVTVRMPTGAGTSAGPFHSQSNEAWFTHVPGLKVVYPSTPEDAKGLLLASLRDPNPVMFFEHKVLYRSISGPVPDVDYEIPLGKARVVCEGSLATIVTYGAAVHWAIEQADRVHGIEVVDLRTLLPWDRETVFESVRKTGKCLVLHEDTQFGGVGGEIAAAIGESVFDDLDAPVMRLGSLDTPVPFARPLEEDFLARRRLVDFVDRLVHY
ncbi:MAG: dehydrogenase E1 component subunit alpha/beta [Myxococcota bacterium]